MTLTHADRATLIDALRIAAEDQREALRSALPSDRKRWRTDQRELHRETTAQIRRFNELRTRLVAEERIDETGALRSRPRPTRRECDCT